MMGRKSYRRFHLAPLSLTWRGHIEVLHILEGHNLVTLADTAKRMEWKSYALSFGTINFDLD